MIPILPLCLACLLAFVIPAGAEDTGEPPERLGPVPECSHHVLGRTWNERQYYRLEYPQCGLEPLDEWVRVAAQAEADETRDTIEALRRDDDFADCPQEILWGYGLYAPGERYLSVVVYIWRYLGGAHGLTGSFTITFDRQLSRQVLIGDLFTDWKRALEELPGIMREVLYEEYPDCAEEDVFQAYDTILHEQSTGFRLEPDGLVPMYPFGPPDKWTCGAFLIPRERLLEIGAKPEIWPEHP